MVEVTAKCRLGAAWALVAAVWMVGGCGQDPAGPRPPARQYSVGAPVCPSGASKPAASVFPDIETIGTSANVVTAGGGYLWVVESGENTVSRFDPDSGQFDRYFIDVGNNRSPWDVFVDAARHRAYITNWQADTVSVADTRTGEVVGEIVDDSFDGPEGIAATDDYMYVTNSNYRSRRDYGPGSVSVVDRRSDEVVAEVATAQKNPQFIRAISTEGGPRLVVVNTGPVSTDGRALGAGGLEVWRETDDPARPDAQAFALPVGADARLGAPGKPLVTPDGARIYLASATAPVLFEFDLRAGRWLHDTADPIDLYQTANKALHNAAIDAGGYIYVTAFNTDAMYVFDTHCNEVLAGPINLGTTDQYIEGPQDVAIVGSNATYTRAYVPMSRSNALAKVAFEF